MVVVFTVDGVGACYYDVASMVTSFHTFNFFNPQLLIAGRKNLNDALLVSGPPIPR